MFATFFELFYYLFGVEIPILKIIKTFGFLMACAFLTGGIVVTREFKNLESKGLFKPTDEKFVRGGGLSIFDWVSNILLGGLLGYKLSLMIVNWNKFSEINPDDFLLSFDGYWWGAVIGAVLITGLAYWGRKKENEQIAEFVRDGKNPFPNTNFNASTYKNGQELNLIKKVLPSERVPELITIAAVSGVLGAKLFSWFEDWDSFLNDPIGHLLSLSGLTFYGGLICASLALIYYAYSKKMNILRIMDAGSLAIMLGYGVGRLGCHFSGDGDWGDPNPYTRPDFLSWLPDWAWAYTYPGNVNKEGKRMADCISEYCYELYEAVYPTPVWEFTMAVIIFLILYSLRNKLIHLPGMLFAVYLMFNGIERFTIEIIRVNADYNVLGFMLSFSQVIAIGLVLTGILMALALRFYYSKNPVKIS